MDIDSSPLPSVCTVKRMFGVVILVEHGLLDALLVEDMGIDVGVAEERMIQSVLKTDEVTS